MNVEPGSDGGLRIRLWIGQCEWPNAPGDADGRVDAPVRATIRGLHLPTGAVTVA
jgi:hypothetical protein